MTTVIGFLIVINVCVLVHEFGHFITAKFFGLRVYVFSLGFGPRLLGMRIGQTYYRLSLLPLGGYVKFSGENPGEVTDDPNAFSRKPRWQRFLMVFAGPTASAILAIVLLAGVYMVRYTRPAYLDKKPMIGYVAPASRAASAGLSDGDYITRVNDHTVSTWEEATVALALGSKKIIRLGIERKGRYLQLLLSLEGIEFSGLDSVGLLPAEPLIVNNVQNVSPSAKASFMPGDKILEVDGAPIASVLGFREAIQKRKGESTNVLVQRDKAVLRIAVAATYNEKEAVWLIGLAFRQNILETSLSPRQALATSWRVNTGLIKVNIAFLGGLFAGTSSPTLMAGPVRIAKMSGECAQYGLPELLGFIAFISMSLAFMNLLPIPALDGGLMFILLTEMFMRRDLDVRFKTALQYIGAACIVSLAAFAIFNDLRALGN